MKIKWVEDQLVSTTVHAVVGTERIGSITKSAMREEYTWFSPILPTANNKAITQKKAKELASKSWHGWLKRCGYRAPRPLRPRYPKRCY